MDEVKAVGTIRDVFETEFCQRCGGSGWHSRCQTWGSTCFQCGVRPHAQGTGRRLTRRGKAAYDFYLSLLPTRRAADLQSGDVIRDRFGRYTVVEVKPSESRSWHMHEGQRIESPPGLDVVTKSVTFCGAPVDQVWTLQPTAEERQRCLAEALAYQATLTKLGKPRKVRKQEAA